MMKGQFKGLEEHLKTVTWRGPVYYLANPGNWGDAVIRYGTLKFLSDINLDFKEIKRSEIGSLTLGKRQWLTSLLQGGTVIYGGGGAWCKLWNHSVIYVNRLAQRYPVVVLPSTYESSYSINGVTFFRRDNYESLDNMPNSIFCHDMAFYIGSEFLEKDRGSGTGYFFRTDAESSGRIDIPLANTDISAQNKSYNTDQFVDISDFFKEVNRFSVIHTDRLYICIAACLMEKEVHLYPGSYFKNRAVYMSSIKDNSSNVYFHELPDLQ